MVALTAANVTVTVEKRVIESQRKRNRVKIVFGDGALTYPTGGVPMPAKGVFGMVRELESLTFYDMAHANGFVYKYDRDNNKMVIYAETTVATNQPLLEATTGLAPASTTLVCEAVGW
jgi:hypothetical protein